jgi:hypothetical protein
MQRNMQGQRERAHAHAGEESGFSLTSICQYGVRWASVIMDDTLDTGGALFHGIGGTNWWD